MLTYGEESELCLINPIIGRCRQQTSVSAGSQTLLNLKSIRPLFCGDSIILVTINQILIMGPILVTLLKSMACFLDVAPSPRKFKLHFDEGRAI